MKLSLASALLVSIAMMSGSAIICAAILRPRDESRYSYVTLSYTRAINQNSTHHEKLFRIDRQTGQATLVVTSVPPNAP